MLSAVALVAVAIVAVLLILVGIVNVYGEDRDEMEWKD